MGLLARDYYYYHQNVDFTFLENGLTDYDETFRDYGVWIHGGEQL